MVWVVGHAYLLTTFTVVCWCFAGLVVCCGCCWFLGFVFCGLFNMLVFFVVVYFLVLFG